MAEPALTDVFPGTTQTATTITIPKSVFPLLTPLAVNTGDQIAVALLLRLRSFYTSERRTSDPDTSITGALGTPSIDINFETGTNFMVRPIEFNLYSTLSLPELDPDSY